MNIIQSSSPRLTRSAALINKPFVVDDILVASGKRAFLGDQIFMLGKVTPVGQNWRVEIDEKTPTVLVNDVLQDVVKEATGQMLPVVSSAQDPMSSMKFMSAPAPHSCIAGDAILWVNDRLAMLRRDNNLPESGFPGYLTVPGGYWGGGPLKKVATTELGEEIRVVQVDKIDDNRRAEITVFDFIMTGKQIVQRPKLSMVALAAISNNLKKWHDVSEVAACKQRPLRLKPRNDNVVPISTVNVVVNGVLTEKFEAWAGWQYWQGKMNGEDFAGHLNTFGIVQIFDASVEGRWPIEVPALTGKPVSAQAGDILIVDSEKFQRAGGAVAVDAIRPDDKLLPVTQAYVAALRANRL